MARIFNRNVSNKAHETLKANSGQGIRNFSFTPAGGWVVITNRNAHFSHNIPDACRQQIEAFRQQNHKILCVAFPPQGGNRWCIVTDRGFSNHEIPDECHKRMLEFHKKGQRVRFVAFPPGRSNAWVVVTASDFYARNIPDECYQIIRNIHQGRRRVQSVAFDPDGNGWVVLAGDYFFTRNVDGELFEQLQQFNKDRWKLKVVAFDPDRRGWSVSANNQFRRQIVEPVREFENKVAGASIWKQMRDRKVPGIAVSAVINNRVAWSTGYGHLKRGSDHAVHPESRFQAASISKVITALGMLRAQRLGLLDIDDDVTTLLTSWSLTFARGVRGRVPLRDLLSHTGGTNVGGFPGYVPGSPIPSLLQVLNGTRPPAHSKSKPVRVIYTPRSAASYSGGGFQVLQQVLEDVTGQPFSNWIDENLLSRIGMNDTVFATTAPREPLRDHQVAAGHLNGRPIEGDRNRYPEATAAGAYSTVLDLARMIILINRGGTAVRRQIIRSEQIDDLLKPQHKFFVDKIKKTVRGLAVILNQRDDRHELGFNYSHGGTNKGFRSAFMGFPNRGTGVVVMTNGNDRKLRWQIAEAVANEYGWLSDT